MITNLISSELVCGCLLVSLQDKKWVVILFNFRNLGIETFGVLSAFEREREICKSKEMSKKETGMGYLMVVGHMKSVSSTTSSPLLLYSHAYISVWFSVSSSNNFGIGEREGGRFKGRTQHLNGHLDNKLTGNVRGWSFTCRITQLPLLQ